MIYFYLFIFMIYWFIENSIAHYITLNLFNIIYLYYLFKLFIFFIME